MTSFATPAAKFNLKSIFQSAPSNSKGQALPEPFLNDYGGIHKTALPLSLQNERSGSKSQSLLLSMKDKPQYQHDSLSQYSNSPQNGQESVLDNKEKLKDWLIGKQDLEIDSIIKQSSNKRRRVVKPSTFSNDFNENSFDSNNSQNAQNSNVANNSSSIQIQRNRQINNNNNSYDIPMANNSPNTEERTQLSSFAPNPSSFKRQYQIGLGSLQLIKIPEEILQQQQLEEQNKESEIKKAGTRITTRKASESISTYQMTDPSTKQQSNGTNRLKEQQENKNSSMNNFERRPSIELELEQNNIPQPKKRQTRIQASSCTEIQLNQDEQFKENQSQNSYYKNASQLVNIKNPFNTPSAKRLIIDAQIKNNISINSNNDDDNTYLSQSNLITQTQPMRSNNRSFQQDRQQTKFENVSFINNPKQDITQERISNFNQQKTNGSTIEDNLFGEPLNRIQLHSRRLNRKLLPNSLGQFQTQSGTIIARSQSPKSILKTVSSLKPVLFSSGSKKVIFNEKVVQFQI